ncbi:MAG: helix-turn-helix domain-containing protein [Candidatus Woesebacteria bacterium]|nr:helix-turn-helix domain-containing protein [Candidatus Woesebacteria bacterium]
MAPINPRKELAPQADTGEAKAQLLETIREKYKGETGATHARRIRDALRLGPLSTFEARRYLDVPHPAGRVQELRDAGNEIDTLRLVERSEVGRPHRIALYVLRKEVGNECRSSS